MDLFFIGEKKDQLRIRIYGKRIFFMDITATGQLINAPIEKVLSHAIKKHNKDETRKQEELEKIKKMEEIVKGMNSQEEVENYVIKEITSLGFNLVKIQREGSRPVFVRNNR